MKRKIAIPTLSAVVVLSAVAFVVVRSIATRDVRARLQWKKETLPELQRRSADHEWIRSERAAIQKTLEASHDGAETGFFTSRLILMKNGDVFVYASRCCSKHANDILIGTTPNGRWYYTSYHFCERMMMLSMAGQPASFASFAENYNLREFDGCSDQCLEQTVTPVRTGKWTGQEESQSEGRTVDVR